MNILFIAGFKIDENKGGVQRVTALLARGLINRGFGITYLALKEGKQESIDGIEQYYIPSSKLFYSTTNIIFLRKLIRDNNISIVINQSGIFPDPLLLIKSAQQTLDFTLFTVHHNCIECLIANYRNIALDNIKNKAIIKYFDFEIVWKILKLKNKIKYGRYFKNAITHSDKLVLLSKKFIPELNVYLKNIQHDKIIAINNPLSFSNAAFTNLEKENALLYVGRINSGQKRSERILEIWEKLYKKFPDWRFDIVGDGPTKIELAKLSSVKGLERIYFHGYMDPRPFYERSKIFCLTSDFEGFGMVLAEAQAYGVVPIAFNSFAVVDDMIENGGSGVIVEKDNMDSYVQEIEKLINDPVYLKKLSERGKVHILKYSLENIVEEWIHLFKEMKIII